MSSRLERILQRLFLVALIIFQPLLIVALTINPPVASAQIDKPEDVPAVDEVGDPANGILPDSWVSPEDVSVQPGDTTVTNFDQLSELDSAGSKLVISPDDLNAIKDEKVDVRVTDYLLQLVLPPDMGGYGLDRIKVNRIDKNYTSDGAGKYDREGTQAADESADVISGHNRGQAVDISEVGEVTCKLVYERHIGGSTTKWQKPTPVKVAWQSVEGAKNNPTPTAQSILGASGELSAQSILAYLNNSGEMDYYVDYVKGMDLKTIVGYVGANIYLKTFGVNQVLSDPFADGLLHALGGSVLEKALPGLPAGIATGTDDEDARISFAKSRIEQGLNLPAGSLKGYGWDSILQATGKRHLETSLGLPNGYFDNHTLDEAMSSQTIKTVIDHFGRSDDGLNLMIGTVAALEKKDDNGFKMAGATILESALHLPADQVKALEQAVKGKKTPGIDLSGVPTGTTVSTNDLKNLFSADPKAQKDVQDSLKQIGLTLVQEASKKAVKGKYSGLTNLILNDLLNPQKTVKLGDIMTSVGASAMGIQVGVNDAGLDKGKVDINSFVSRHATEIATFLNNENSIKDPALQITAADISGLADSKNLSLVEKLGGAQVDKAFGWNSGSTFAVISGKKTLADATTEAFSNFVGKTLGLQNQGVSLTGNIQENYGYAVLSERLGIDQALLKKADHFGDLMFGDLGASSAKRIFNINSPKALSELTSDPNFWSDENNISGWRAIDIALGTPIGTVESYIRGEITTQQLARASTRGSLENFTADKIYDFFGISDQFRLDKTEIEALIKVFRGGDDQTLEDIQTATQTIYRILGRSVDGQADFSKDTFLQYITAPDSASGTKLLLDQGIRLVAQSLGVNLKGFKFEDFQFVADQIKAVFGTKQDADSFLKAYGISLPDVERLRQEYAQLKAVDPNKLTAEQKARIDELNHNGPLQSYVRVATGVSDFLVNATGIPPQFRTDAESFIAGDWRLGIAATSFAALLPQINQFMPKDNQFSYADMRGALIQDNYDVIQNRVNEINQKANVTNEDPNGEAHQITFNEARRQLMEEAQKNIEYRMSDSLLRKLDPAIPVGFSQVLFSGTEAERGALLQNFAFAKLDIELARLSPLYQPGMLKALYEGKIDPGTTDKIVLNLINQTGISFGSFSSEFVSNFYQFSRSQGAADFFTNTKYGSMWGFFDKWLSDNLNIGSLPTGVAKSLYYAAKNNWDLNAELKSNGNVVVQSLNSLGKDLLINKFGEWGDHQFNLPIGSIYKGYQLYVSLQSAQQALSVASAAGGAIDLSLGLQPGTTLANARASYSQAKGALITFAISLALGACSECQKFFGSVDQAIAAPPGFTQALITGLIANALGAGPTGIYIAAAIYLFGVYKVEYLCPEPPQDVWAIPEYDSAADQFDFGVPYDNLPTDYNLISSSPSPGQDQFAWSNGVKFTNGSNQKIWMGWARYYVGKLLDSTFNYGETRDSPWKPLQVITYRQANVEYFTPRSVGAFGELAAGDQRIGIGYSQDSTKTTDWVHIGFGGLY